MPSSNDLGDIRGRVRDPDGRPVADCALLLGGDSPEHRDLAALTDDAGEFSFLDLTPGSYTVLARCGDAEPVELEAQVRPGESVRVEIRCLEP